MLRSAARASAILSDSSNVAAIEAASEYGESLGMAFQIVDDILDFQVRENGDCSFFFLCLVLGRDLLTGFCLSGWNWQEEERGLGVGNRDGAAAVCSRVASRAARAVCAQLSRRGRCRTGAAAAAQQRRNATRENVGGIVLPARQKRLGRIATVAQSSRAPQFGRQGRPEKGIKKMDLCSTKKKKLLHVSTRIQDFVCGGCRSRLNGSIQPSNSVQSLFS